MIYKTQYIPIPTNMDIIAVSIAPIAKYEDVTIRYTCKNGENKAITLAFSLMDDNKHKLSGENIRNYFDNRFGNQSYSAMTVKEVDVKGCSKEYLINESSNGAPNFITIFDQCYILSITTGKEYTIDEIENIIADYNIVAQKIN